MSLPYQNNDKQLLTDLCACTDFITCSCFVFLGGGFVVFFKEKKRQFICIVLISALKQQRWSDTLL